jgi:protein-S-isoprenylcysteine O-methyltransferase Ste14
MTTDHGGVRQTMEDQPIAAAGRVRYWLVVTRGFLRFFVALVAMFAVAGRMDYWQLWVWGGANVLVGLVVAISFRTQPDLIEERVKPGPGTKRWDKVFFAVWLPTLLSLLGVAALDGGRLHWSPPIAPLVYAAGYVALAFGYALTLWAMWTNRFFSAVVRIQTDRGHSVVQEGPYRFVRHPGYAGVVFLPIATALTLGSLWALIPVGLGVVLFVIRTALEDATLQRELPGYAEYARKVRYRLLPGVW